MKPMPKHTASGDQMRRFNILLWFLIMASLFAIGRWYIHGCSCSPFRPTPPNAFSLAYASVDPLTAHITVHFNEPLLCYHQLWGLNCVDSKTARTYTVRVQRFHKQMKILHDNGYHAILPDHWNDHMQRRVPME
jgi:hypothetical protein